MPELPDVTVYVEALNAHVRGQLLEGVRLASPFVLRTFDPPIRAAAGKRVREVRRLGKRLVFALDDELFLVIHLMIAGRLRWAERSAKIPGKVGLAALDFPNGAVLLTEASPKKRASIHLVRGEDAVRAIDRGGIEPLTSTRAQFREALMRENHTLKRSLTDPRLFSGIGNAYSDEILHRAKLSPTQLSTKLDDGELDRLFEATQTVLTEWTDRLRKESQENGGWPEKVTAFRDEMAVHGKYRQPCPVCGTPVQRIAYADNETNYCPRCQTSGKILSDRSLARLLKEDWPKTIEELEERFPAKTR